MLIAKCNGIAATRAICLWMLIPVVAACGGGGGGGGAVPPPVSTAEGLWKGTTNSGRTIVGIVLDDGEYWIIYTAMGNSAVTSGGVQGHSSAQNGSLSSSDGKDFNFEGLGVNALTVSATYVQKQSIGGSLNYTATGTQFTFTGAYVSSYDLTPNLATIAGTYSGAAFTSGGADSATTTISSSGALAGTSGNGCSYTGTVSPRTHGNVYNVAVTFAGGVCSNGTSAVVGVGYFDATTNEFVAAALDSSRTNGFITTGTKP